MSVTGVDLSTDYLGLKLRNPVVAGASPLSRDVAMVRRMEPGSVIVLNDSAIIAQADAGAGGNILLEASLLLADTSSLISASSNSGVDGTVVTRAPDGQLIDLSQDLQAPSLDVSALLSEPCAARRPSGTNSLVVTQSDGMPLNVDAVLPGFLSDGVYAELGEAEAIAADRLEVAANDAGGRHADARCVN